MGDRPSRFRVIAWVLAGALTSLAALTSLTALAGPAAADPGEFELRMSTDKIQLQTGGAPQRLTAVARFTGEDLSGEQVHLVFHVPLAEHNVGIAEAAEGCQVAHTQMRCPVTMDGNEHRYSLQIGPPADGGPAAGEQVKGDGAVRLEWPDDPHGEPIRSAPYRVTLASAATSVNEVSGKVFDQEAQEPLAGASVAIQDSDDKTWETSTDADGQFRVGTSSEKPLTPGTFTIKVSKKGFQSYEVRLQEGAGESITGLQMFLVPAPKAKAAATPDQSEAAKDSGSWLPWLVGLFGALLVIGGAVAAYVLWRRSESDAREAPGGLTLADLAPGAFEAGHGAPAPRHGGGQPAADMGATRVFDRPGHHVGRQPDRRLDHPTTVVGGPAGFDHPTTVVGSREPVGPHADDDLGALVRRSIDQPRRVSPPTQADRPTHVNRPTPWEEPS